MEHTLWGRLDLISARLAVPAGLAVGAALAWATWTLPAPIAAPLFLLLLSGGIALAFRGDPVLVPERPQERAVPQPPERPPPVPEDWWVDIPAGRFRMGSPDDEPGRGAGEGPLHEVRVSAFRCLRYPITRGIERQLNGEAQAPLGRDDPPLVDVSWLDAVRFCNRLSEADGLAPCYRIEGEDATWERTADGYRLLTEAEWEYACRAGTATRWSFGDDEAKLGEHAWYADNSDCIGR